MLYGRIDRYQAHMDNPMPPVYNVDDLTKFAYTLVKYFIKWENLAQKWAEESKNTEAWDEARSRWRTLRTG